MSDTTPLRWMYTVGAPSWASLQANAANIDVISPNYYFLTSQGTLSGGNQSAVTDFARSKGIKVIPMLQNNQHDKPEDTFNPNLSNPAKVQALLDALQREVQQNNYDGIQIDFENLNPASETILTGFMQALYGRLHPLGKLVTMAVVARTAQSSAPFKKAYNYAALAPFVDLVTVMTYDFAGPGWPPGAVAPIPTQEAVMNYALPFFGAQKLLLGVPFYGYDWNVTAQARADSHTCDEIAGLQRQFNGQFGFDETAQSPFLDYTTGGQQHKVWFENTRSIQAKLDLMKRLGLRGMAAWRLGHEGADFWPLLAALGKDESLNFSQTGQSIAGPFKAYWQTNGGLARFGYPISAQIAPTDPAGPTVQYFERARFELHANQIILGLLGREVTANRQNEAPFQPVGDPGQPGQIQVFGPVGHTLRGPFAAYWQANGGLPVFGYPISEEFQETNSDDGQTYTVQYFERARFELHAGTPPSVLLGLLGRQVWQAHQ